MKNYIMTGILCIVLAAASLFLPSAVMEWQDEQRTGKSETEEVQEVVLREQVSMTLSEKLRLRSQDTVNALTLVNGKNYNQDTIDEQVRKEIGILAEQEILIDFDADLLKVVEASAFFYVDMEDSERSIMLWEGAAESLDCQLTFTMDDETGKIVSFSQYIYEGVPYDEYDMQSTSVSVSRYAWDASDMGIEELQEKAERWGSYLGYEVTDSHSVWIGEDFGIDAEEFTEHLERMISKGYSREEAEIMAAREWGLDTSGRQFYANLEDEDDRIEYLLRPEKLMFRIEPILE